MSTTDKTSATAAAGPVFSDGLGVWEPMRTAPRDGTAILVLLDGSDIPHAARWLAADDARGSGAEGWHLTWDGYWLHRPRYWMWCPDDPDELTPNDRGNGPGAAERK